MQKRPPPAVIAILIFRFNNSEMSILNGYERIAIISEYIMESRSRDQVIGHLSMHACPLGMSAGVESAILNKDGFIVTEVRFGIAETSSTLSRIHISADHPMASALRTLKTQVNNQRDLFQFSIAMPITVSRLYAFSFEKDVTQFENYLSYFECIASMLQFWERSNGQIADAVIPVSADKKRELSERQKVILDLIEHGKTNNIIARELGFSESLIRQETISIYKKLGIQGRKNLTIKSADPHSSAH